MSATAERAKKKTKLNGASFKDDVKRLLRWGPLMAAKASRAVGIEPPDRGA